ncbi:BglG family transcription antiterminator [Erysipelotrichaceae bacterium HCN-30851]
MRTRQFSRKDEILLDLLEDNNNISFSGLCIRFKVSERTMRKEISDIKDILKKYELKLVKNKNKLFQIKCENEKDKINIETLKSEIKDNYSKVHYEMRNDRLIYLLQRLLLSQNYIRLNDLADEMYVSKSTISADMKQVREILDSYKIAISNKPHYGMKAEGSESSIRKCILDYGLINEDIFSPNDSVDVWSKIVNDPDYEVVKNVLDEVISQPQFNAYKTFLNNLVMHIILAIKRIRSHCYVEQLYIQEGEQYEQEYEVAKQIVAGLNKVMDIHFPESEIKYLQFHLIGKQNELSDFGEYDDLKYLTDRMLQTSSELYNCEFNNDSLLREDLFVHLKAVKSRLEVGTKLRNPMLEEIKSQYPFAFEIAVNSVKNDWNWMWMISDDEIGYIAVHYAASLERSYQRKKYTPKNVLLVCSSGVGTARLMEARLKQYFKMKINLVVFQSFMDVNEINYAAYDLILSTVPIKESKPNVMCIRAIPSYDEMKKIHQKLFHEEDKTFSIQDVFKKEYFLIRDHAEKEEILKEICNQFYEDNVVEDGFYEAVLQREECSTTAVGNLVALPHSIKPLSRKSVIYTCIFKNSIAWTEDNDVQIVFLLAIKFRDSKWFTDIYDMIVRLVENKELVYRCIDCNNYEDFINVLYSIQRNGEGTV